MVQTQRQRSNDARAALIQQLKGYLQRFQSLLYTIQFGDTDKIDIKKETVDLFLRDLTEIARGINSLRPVQNLLQALPWVDGLLGSIEGARNALRLVRFFLDNSQTAKSVKSRLDSYTECQNYLSQVITQLSNLTG